MSVVRRGAFAGTVAAAVMDGYRLGVPYLIAGRAPEDHYRYVASAVLRDGAYALPGAAWLGFLLHLFVGATWGIAFASAATRTPSLVQRPIVSGFVFGAVVYVIMRAVTVAGGIAQRATPALAFFEFVSHTLFFGVPVALIVARRLRAA